MHLTSYKSLTWGWGGEHGCALGWEGELGCALKF